MVNAEVLNVDCNDMPINRLIYLYYNIVVPVTIPNIIAAINNVMVYMCKL